MFKKFAFVLALTGLVVLGGPVLAQNNSTDRDTATDTQNTNTQATDADRETRKEERKARITERIDEARQKRVAARCVAAQEKLTTILSRVETVKKDREVVYLSLSSRLIDFKERLMNNGIDPTSLDEPIMGQIDLAEDFQESIEAYRIALDDAAAVDCESEPENFYLALVDAREQRAAAREDAKAIREYVKTDVKDALMALKTKLNQTSDEPAELDDEATTSEADTNDSGNEE